MEDIKDKRMKKSDKAKRNFEITGGLSKKHIRMTEQLLEKRLADTKRGPKQ